MKSSLGCSHYTKIKKKKQQQQQHDDSRRHSEPSEGSARAWVSIPARSNAIQSSPLVYLYKRLIEAPACAIKRWTFRPDIRRCNKVTCACLVLWCICVHFATTCPDVPNRPVSLRTRTKSNLPVFPLTRSESGRNLCFARFSCPKEEKEAIHEKRANISVKRRSYSNLPLPGAAARSHIIHAGSGSKPRFGFPT